MVLKKRVHRAPPGQGSETTVRAQEKMGHSSMSKGWRDHTSPAEARVSWVMDEVMSGRMSQADGMVEMAIEGFENPRDPILLLRPTCQFCHLCIWQDGACGRASSALEIAVPSDGWPCGRSGRWRGRGWRCALTTFARA